MLTRKELIKDVESKYVPMLEQVNIANFIKCIAVFSGLNLDEVADFRIKEYLLIWAENKYRLFELFGNKIFIDFDINYEDPDHRNHIKDMYKDLTLKYPVYAPWINMFTYSRENLINERDIEWKNTKLIQELFVNKKIVNTLPITKFFKQYLTAPDELITDIGRIYENKKIKGIYTWSIDPVDMMLASVNGYNWTSCYSIKNGGYATGCLAAVLDENSTISYIGAKNKDLKLESYGLKNINDKKIRMWVDINEDFESLFFHDTYPCRDAQDSFKSTLRDCIETYIANYKNVKNIWTPVSTDLYNRIFVYGYDESRNGCGYVLKEAFQRENEDEQVFNIKIYTHEYKCACGCDFYIPEEIDEEGRYSKDEHGFNCRTIYENNYCEDCESCYSGDYCCCHDEYCENCDEYYNGERYDKCPYCSKDEEKDS